MTYQEATAYLESFVNYERLNSYDYRNSFKLDRMRALASLLGDPQKGIRSIHIAGTKGKGSTAAITHSILKKAGFKTALYTSPHLISFRERISINDELISEGDLLKILEKIRGAVEKMGEEEKPSFFEIYTAAAYIYFKDKKADFAVYETGLGGRLDATNIVEPLVCAITPISYDHIQILGSTLSEIAVEKAGIIKEGIICVSAPQEPEALEVIEKVCRMKGSRLILVGKDITFEETDSSDRGETFNVRGLLERYSGLELRLLGSHQVVNAATAIGIAESLSLSGIRIGRASIIEGVKDAFWPGRLEVIGESPLLVIDGAQNKASANALANSVKKVFLDKVRYRRLILVFGASKDKDIKGMLEELMPISDSVILTKSRVWERAMEPSAIKGLMGREDAALTSNTEDAIRMAVAMAGKDDIILATGSLFVVGEVRGFKHV